MATTVDWALAGKMGRVFADVYFGGLLNANGTLNLKKRPTEAKIKAEAIRLAARFYKEFDEEANEAFVRAFVKVTEDFILQALTEPLH